MTNRNTETLAFLADAGWQDSVSTMFAGDASNRSYQRLTKEGATAILMDAPPSKGEDVSAFVRMAEFLTFHGMSAPYIYARNLPRGLLLIEDLGDDLFARLMAQDATCQNGLYEAATDVLVTLHKTPPPALEVCDADWLVRMSDLPFEWYADDKSGEAFSAFSETLAGLAKPHDTVPKVVALRDYHAENLLWLPDRTGVARVGLLDFQDAFLAHPAYDLVSVMQDARRDVTVEIEANMIRHYLNQTKLDETGFKSAYALLGAQRNLRIVGVFARLCLRDGKAHYVDMIPRVWGYAMRNLRHPDLGVLQSIVLQTLPEPTPALLNELKSRCAVTH